MTKLAIVTAGLLALLLLELGFSLELRRYDVPGERYTFFRGPISTSLAAAYQASLVLGGIEPCDRLGAQASPVRTGSPARNAR